MIYSRLFAERRVRIKVTHYLYQGVCQNDVRKQSVMSPVCLQFVFTVVSRDVGEWGDPPEVYLYPFGAHSRLYIKRNQMFQTMSLIILKYARERKSY